MRFLQLAIFHIRVVITKIAIVVIAVPLGIVMIPIGAMRGKEDIRDLFMLFRPKEWKEIWGTGVEALVGSRWFIELPAKNTPPSLPRYCYWDAESRNICCVLLEDAVAMNLKYGGTLTRHPNKTIK